MEGHLPPPPPGSREMIGRTIRTFTGAPELPTQKRVAITDQEMVLCSHKSLK